MVLRLSVLVNSCVSTRTVRLCKQKPAKMNGFEDVSATKPSKIWDHWLYNKTTGMDENENEASDAEKMMTMMMALSESVELNPQYKEIIGRVRKVCKMFKRSPVKKFRNSKASLSKI